MKLVYPSKKYLESYQEAGEEYHKHNVTTYAFDDDTTSENGVVFFFLQECFGIRFKDDIMAVRRL